MKVPLVHTFAAQFNKKFKYFLPSSFNFCVYNVFTFQFHFRKSNFIFLFFHHFQNNQKFNLVFRTKMLSTECFPPSNLWFTWNKVEDWKSYFLPRHPLLLHQQPDVLLAIRTNLSGTWSRTKSSSSIAEMQTFRRKNKNNIL